MQKSKKKNKEDAETQKQNELDSLKPMLDVDFYNLAEGLMWLTELRPNGPNNYKTVLFCGSSPFFFAYNRPVLEGVVVLWDESNCPLPDYKGGFAQSRFIISTIDDGGACFESPIEPLAKAAKRFERLLEAVRGLGGFCPDKAQVEEIKSLGYHLNR